MAANVTDDTNAIGPAVFRSDRFSTKIRHDLIPPTVMHNLFSPNFTGEINSVYDLKIKVYS